VIARADLRELNRPRPARVAAMIVLLAGGWAGLALAARVVEPAWARVPLWLAAGFFVNGLVQLGHDAWHGNLFARRWLNGAVGHVFSLLFGVSFSAARHAHLRHHWHNRTERDPDAYNAGAGWRVKAQFYTVVVAGLALAPLHFNVLYPLVYYKRSQLPAHLVELAVYAAAYVALGSLLPGELVVDLWLMPLLLANPWNGLKSIADHHANVWKGDRFHTATTVRTTRAWSFLWNGLNYHLDHHLYPRVPGYNLARVHARIAPELARRGAPVPELARRGAPVFDGYLRVFWAALRAGPVYVDGNVFLRRAP
jgi:fatty acid desaturase